MVVMNKRKQEKLLALGAEVQNKLPHTGETANYGVYLEDGTSRECGNTSCHAGLSGRKWSSPCLIIQNRVQVNYGKCLKGEMLEEFFKFLFFDSTFAGCYVTKDPSTVVEKGITVDAAHNPANMVVAASIMTRYAWEHLLVGETMVRLARLGVEPKKVELLAHVMYLKENGEFQSRKTIGHTGIYVPCMNKRTVKNFLEDSLDTENVHNTKSYSELSSYKGIDSMWGG